MADTADDEAAEVAIEIVRYLSTHREAADTVGGAARWWLSRQPSQATVERAMEMLVASGAVERHILPEGTVVFRGGPRLHTQTPSTEGHSGTTETNEPASRGAAGSR
jgi:hypothetical protein